MTTVIDRLRYLPAALVRQGLSRFRKPPGPGSAPARRDSALLVAFMPDVLATPQLEIQLEHIQRHLDGGGSAVVLRCDGQLPTCEANVGHDQGLCFQCRQRFEKGVRWLRGSVTEEPFRTLTAEEESFVEDLGRRSWRTVEELCSLRIDRADVGEAAFSTLVAASNDASPDLAQHQESVRRNVATGAMVYFSIKSQLERRRPGVFTVFNARLSSTRPALRAAQALGIDSDVLEVAGVAERYAVFKNALPHDIEPVKQAIDDVFERDRLSDADCEQALEWFRERRAGLTRDWPSYTKRQVPNLLPAELTPDRTNLVIFRSSEYEFAGVSDWRNPFYTTQNDGIARLLADLRNDPVRVILRVHPNQRGMDNLETSQIEALGREHKNLVVVPAASDVSTYALMDAADAVLTYGSTTGIEAAFAGQLSILMGRAEYEDLNVCLRPRSHAELVSLVRRIASGQRPEPPVGLPTGLVKYAHFQQVKGEVHKYVKRTGFFSAKMQRGDAVEAIEGGTSFPPDSFARLTWQAEGMNEVEIRIDRPDGPLVARGEVSGTTLTGPLNRKGMRFLLCGHPQGSTGTELHVLSGVDVLFGSDGWQARPDGIDMTSCSLAVQVE